MTQRQGEGQHGVRIERERERSSESPRMNPKDHASQGGPLLRAGQRSVSLRGLLELV